tara:strand:- start:4837 stop:5610 length:774 start_codon:yes stop_codon:yes gene_type:complete
MKLYSIIKLLLLFVLINACASNPIDKTTDEDEPISVATDFDNKPNKKNIRDAEPFYPMDETIEDIQDQISDLKSRVIEYESRINRISLDPTLLKMVKTPSIQHEIELKNGTIVQGSILQEDIERIILKTQIGQIRIEKIDVVAIKETAPNSPDLKFEFAPTEKQFNDKRVFSGSIVNEGMRRADFARVVFYLWDKETNLIAADSSFIAGSSFQYKSGIVTDTSIEPGEKALFNVSVKTPDSTQVEYITKEIHYNIYE